MGEGRHPEHPTLEPWSDLQDMVAVAAIFHRYQIEAAGKAVGGVEFQYTARGDAAEQEQVGVGHHRLFASFFACRTDNMHGSSTGKGGTYSCTRVVASEKIFIYLFIIGPNRQFIINTF